MNTKEAVVMFITAKRAAGRAETTLDWYAWLLEKFAQAHRVLPTEPEPIEAFIADADGEPETRHAHFRAVRTLYNWLARRRKIAENPMALVEEPKVPRKLPRWLELEECQQLYRAAETPLEIALIRLLLDTGVRVGEARSLDRHQIRDSFIIVRGKTGERIAPVSSRTATRLRSLPVSIIDPDAVFAGEKGRYHVRTLQRAVGRVFIRAGLGGPRSSPHTLRHSFGTLWDGEELVLQDILGHSDIATTRRYRHFRISRAVRQHHTYSPMTAIDAGQLQMDL